MSTPTGQTVGFLGMGIMGEAMARNLLKSGLFKAVYVWNRSADKVRCGWSCCGCARHAIFGPLRCTLNTPQHVSKCTMQALTL